VDAERMRLLGFPPLAAAVGTCVWLSSPFAHSEVTDASIHSGESQWALEFEAPAECPDATQFRRRVDESLPPGSKDLAVETQVERIENDQYRLMLITTAAGQRGERELVDRDCSSVVMTAAAIVAWSMARVSAETTTDPDPTRENANDTSSSRRKNLPRANTERTSPPPVHESPPPPGVDVAEARWQLRLAPQLASGTSPSVTPALLAALARVGGWHELSVSASLAPPLGHEVKELTASFAGFGITAEGCLRHRANDGLVALGCVQAGSDWIRVGSGSLPSAAVDASLRAGAGVALEWSLTPEWALRPYAAGHAFVRRAQFVRREGDVSSAWWNSPPFGAQAGIAFALVF
jgi:hypothetical protein